MLAAAFFLAFSGLAALCLAMHRHHRDLFGTGPSLRVQRGLAAVGGVLIALALFACIHLRGGPVGMVLWLGLLSAAALLLVGLLAWRA